LTLNGLHGVISQKIVRFRTIAVRTSNPTCLLFFYKIKHVVLVFIIRFISPPADSLLSLRRAALMARWYKRQWEFCLPAHQTNSPHAIGRWYFTSPNIVCCQYGSWLGDYACGKRTDLPLSRIWF
jgi:hypothetical protein